MKFEVCEDLIFNEPLPTGGDTKIVLTKGTVVEYVSPSNMNGEDRKWFETLKTRNRFPAWGKTGSGPQRPIPFTWNGKVRVANTPLDLKPVSRGGLLRRFG
jgi:hypothetical protein